MSGDVFRPEIPDPDDPGVYLARFVASAVPMPDGCVFQIAPEDRLVLRVFDDGSVEFGEGVSPPEAALGFWRLIGSLR